MTTPPRATRHRYTCLLPLALLSPPPATPAPGPGWVATALPAGRARLSGPGFTVEPAPGPAGGGPEGVVVRRTGDGAGDVLVYWDAADCGAAAADDSDGLGDYLEWAAGRAPGAHPFQASPPPHTRQQTPLFCPLPYPPTLAGR